MWRQGNNQMTPDVDRYIDKMRRECGELMSGKLRVYLDTKYWVFLRDAQRGRTTPERQEILRLLRELVETNKAICPLSAETFFELLKQTDMESRHVAAKIMDALSKGYCFVSPTQIVGQEIITFIRNAQSKSRGRPTFDQNKYVWTKLPFVLGEIFPKWHAIPITQQQSLQVDFLHQLSKKSLEEIVMMLAEQVPQKHNSNLIERLNRLKDANQSWRTFHQVFMYEIAGALDALRDELENVWVYLFEVDQGKKISIEKLRRLKCVEDLSSLIYRAFDQGSIDQELPFIGIRAGIHAHLRYDKKRRYKSTDIDDFGHAAWALPYCDYFFTDDDLAAIISQRKLDTHYRATVLSKERDVVNCLCKLG